MLLNDMGLPLDLGPPALMGLGLFALRDAAGMVLERASIP
jgi:hypothetical protein